MTQVPAGTLEIRKLSVGPMDNNAYILRDADSGAALLIDAANDADRLTAELRGMDLVAIVTTHGHADHWQALEQVRRSTGAPALLHPGDRGMVPWEPDRDVVEGATIGLGAIDVQLLHTPGHTPGSACVLVGGHVFTGDTLFPGGPGRVRSPADFDRIMESLEARLFVLPDSTWVYPGHGDDTTLGKERPRLPEWRARGW